MKIKKAKVILKTLHDINWFKDGMIIDNLTADEAEEMSALWDKLANKESVENPNYIYYRTEKENDKNVMKAYIIPLYTFTTMIIEREIEQE